MARKRKTKDDERLEGILKGINLSSGRACSLIDIQGMRAIAHSKGKRDVLDRLLPEYFEVKAAIENNVGKITQSAQEIRKETTLTLEAIEKKEPHEKIIAELFLKRLEKHIDAEHSGHFNKPLWVQQVTAALEIYAKGEDKYPLPLMKVTATPKIDEQRFQENKEKWEEIWKKGNKEYPFSKQGLIYFLSAKAQATITIHNKPRTIEAVNRRVDELRAEHEASRQPVRRKIWDRFRKETTTEAPEDSSKQSTSSSSTTKKKPKHSDSKKSITANQVLWGGLGILGTSIAVAGGEKENEQEKQQAQMEGKEYKPKKRWFLRAVGVVAGLFALDALVRGDASILGKHTANWFNEKNKASDKQLGIG